MGTKRQRKYKSKKVALINKAREAMLAAVQIFNNPLIRFKSETFITLAVIAWTYIMHAYFEQIGVDYRYYKKKKEDGRKQFDRTEYGAIKEWELSKCIKAKESPLSASIKANLEFIIGIRNEIEHQMTNELDITISAKLQACALNFNYCISSWFGKRYAIENELVMSIHFAGISPTQQKDLSKMKGIAPNLSNYIAKFENNISLEILNNQEYSYHIMYIPINANNKGHVDSVIEFVKATDEQQEAIQRVLIKEKEKTKYLPKQIVDIMKEKGYKKFTIHAHTLIWQNNGNSLRTEQYGCNVAGKYWCWYESWLKYVEAYCAEHAVEFGKT